MKKLFILLSSLFLLQQPSFVSAQVQSQSEGSLTGAEASSSSSGNLGISQLRQEDITNNTSTVGGTVNNVGVNNSTGLFLPSTAVQDGVECDVPVWEFSIVGTAPNNGFDASGALLTGIRIPLGSRAHNACERRSQLKLRQAELDTMINLAKFCLELDQLGISINIEQSPEELINACRVVGLVE